MTRIYKHTFDWGDRMVSIPNCLRILHVGTQNGLPTIWYVHSDKPAFESPNESGMTLQVRCTGEDFRLDLAYIGTLMTDDQSFVIHLFS